ncbi:MAG: DUF4143 domain-containing protein, partial [Clostridiales bacterium]|nr:DUF4143 domain-containing protein [Clostridiales bacterium]
TFDDYVLLDGVKKDALGFVRGLKVPAILDEIQYAPEVLRPLKMRIDREQASGAFLMTGSQQFELMKGVSESLAGRIGILSLSGLSSREKDGIAFDKPFLPIDEYLAARRGEAVRHSPDEFWRRVQRGSMPKLCAEPEIAPLDYYSGYVKTYIERDVRALTQVGDELAFLRFLTACAARTAQLLNMSDICRDVGIAVPTAKRWLSVLVASGIVYLLQPYSRNIAARAVKTPKLYFMDTGLVSYLCKWTSPETLENGAMSGPIFETYAVSEIIKSYQNAGMEPPIYFYRDSEKREIDLVFELDGKAYPVEIKKTASPNASDARYFGCIKSGGGIEAMPGGIVCMYDKLLSLGNAKTIPIELL